MTNKLRYKPAQTPYDAVHQVFCYLAHTIDDGIYFWHDHPVKNLPEGTMPTLYPDNYTLVTTPPQTMHEYVDLDWAGDLTHHNSTACNARKMILYFWSLLQEVNIEQNDVTILFEDNCGALMMADAQQPA